MSALRLNRLPLLFPVLLALMLGYLLGNARSELNAQSSFNLSWEEEELFETFWQVWEYVRGEFVDPNGADIDPASLTDGAIRGMVKALGDEHSGYLDAQQYPVMQEDMSGSIQGIGAVVQRDENSGFLQIAYVLTGTPAAAAGLQSGDVFAEVDGLDVLDASQLELAALVRGPAGSAVQLTMYRGAETLNFTIERARIAVPNIEWRLLEDSGFGYVSLQHFNASARADLDDAFAEMDVHSLPGLVLDLRGNPGGLLDSAIEIASAFIEEGPVAIQDFDTRERILDADGSHAGLTLPLAVLVDGRSASASELVAGALQDRGRATIVGEQTFGKGTMQNLFTLSNGGGLQLTIARWLTPDGNWIHGSGITPDLLVAQADEIATTGADAQLQAAIAHLLAQGADIAA